MRSGETLDYDGYRIDTVGLDVDGWGCDSA
jgi:hypothetical protein